MFRSRECQISMSLGRQSVDTFRRAMDVRLRCHFPTLLGRRGDVVSRYVEIMSSVRPTDIRLKHRNVTSLVYLCDVQTILFSYLPILDPATG